ncbi:MAG: hypothetical protein JSW73_00330 [Candidatus Woesearchaeota archaeon]|nr:MAG: hypothetical protein JSW73_00330 [Candidatus Woesearchaeota archaeon]
MFEKYTCPRCEFFVKQSWNFCPHCGINLKELPSPEPEPMPIMMKSNLFSNSDMEELSKEVNKIFRSILGQEPFSGSVSITRIGGPEGSKTDVRTSGDYKKLEPQIKKKLGIKKRDGKPKTTKEPAIKVKEMPHENIIEIKVPGVKKESDIEIIQLEQSMEVRAVTKDKVYFKLIPIPENSQIIEKTLSKGVLKIRLKK